LLELCLGCLWWGDDEVVAVVGGAATAEVLILAGEACWVLLDFPCSIWSKTKNKHIYLNTK